MSFPIALLVLLLLTALNIYDTRHLLDAIGDSARRNLWGLSAGSASSLLVLTLIYVRLRRETTARREAVLALRRANENLEHRVVERTADLQKSEQRYRDLFGAITDSIIVWEVDADGAPLRFEDLNDAACKLLGGEREEILRLPIMGFAQPGASPTPQELIANLRLSGRLVFERMVTTLRGERVPIEMSARLFDMDGRSFVMGVGRDITERRSLEEQFRQVQKMEAIGQLAGGIAHDFNNILAAIGGNLELAFQDVPAGHPARESLDEIAKAMRRAKSLVRRIVTFARQQSDERRLVSLGPLVEESVGLLRATLPAGVRLSVTCSPDTPNVLADVTQVQQVILNLGTNAWHAMEGQSGSIAVSLEPSEVPTGQSPRNVGPGRYARLSVADTGVGMSAATVERIFEPFFTTKAPGHGTGLGLSVVHGIVRAHEGEIAVQSVPGQGSTFEIYLPAVEAEITPPAVAAAPAEILGRGEHILYLDDEAALVELAVRQLQRLGYRVSGFTEAPKALQAFRNGPEQFDIAVTDFNMPGHSGLQVARDLLTVRPDLPVVLTSGYVTDELREAAARLDIEVVYKPNTADELFEVIHRLVNDSTRSRAPSR